MYLFLHESDYRFEIENIVRLYDLNLMVAAGRPDRNIDFVYVRAAKIKSRTDIFCYYRIKGKCLYTRSFLGSIDKHSIEMGLGSAIYKTLSDIFGIIPPWGIVTGIRPAKYACQRFKETGSYDIVFKEFTENCLMLPQKARLAIETARNSEPIHKLCEEKTASLYISIPFCPTRCSYCSFVSKTIERDGGLLLNDYLNCLCLELSQTLDMINELGVRLLTVYFGGGTPSVLMPNDIYRLTKIISDKIDTGSLLEYTFEAGRPDTISEDKLAVLKDAGVTRLCINPQTFNNDVLLEIGRRHKAEDTDRAFGLARRLGFNNINSDLIAGLPKDSEDSFKKSLEHMIDLAPEGITVHALTLKRSSNLREQIPRLHSDVSKMVDYAYERLTETGYLPYYLYKQKGTIENVENVGYSKKDHFGMYNVFIMDEVHTIIACGAGAVTKLVAPGSQRIERIFNYKYPAEYISGFSEMSVRKRRIYEYFKSGISTEN